MSKVIKFPSKQKKMTEPVIRQWIFSIAKTLDIFNQIIEGQNDLLKIQQDRITMLESRMFRIEQRGDAA